MAKIGIIFAMNEELVELKKYIEIHEEKKFYDLVFYCGSLGGHDVILVECGIGKVHAARCTQVLIDQMNIDYVFNIGVAGGVNPSVSIGDIVVGERLVQHDYDITAFGHELGYVPNVGVYVDSDPYLLEVATTSKQDGVYQGVIASGDSFFTDLSKSQELASKFHALCVEMEGASIAQVCFLCKVPFLVIRSISDSPYQGDSISSYEEFLEDSSKKVALFLNNIIEKLGK